MPWKARHHENWGIFKRHFWRVYVRHSHTHAALTERAHWLAVEWLPRYAPELNDIEVVWGDLKARHLAHQTFTDPGVLDQTIHHAVAALNSQRSRIPLPTQRISA